MSGENKKKELLEFLEDRVLRPAENHPNASPSVKKKVRTTRLRLGQCADAKKVEQFFWSMMANDRDIDSYDARNKNGATTFEDVIKDFKTICQD